MEDIIHAMKINPPKGKNPSFGDEKTFVVSYFSPWGMHNTLTKRGSYKNVFANFNVFPERVKIELNLTAEYFDQEKIKVTVTNTGHQPAAKFNRIYCGHCETTILPKVLNNEQFGNQKSA